MSFAFYFNFVNMAVGVNLVFIFTLYFGCNGVTYVFVNELVEPFVVGIGFAVSWGLRALLGVLIPLVYDNFPLYWTPMIQAIIGTVLFIFYAPVFLETRG